MPYFKVKPLAIFVVAAVAQLFVSTVGTLPTSKVKLYASDSSDTPLQFDKS